MKNSAQFWFCLAGLISLSPAKLIAQDTPPCDSIYFQNGEVIGVKMLDLEDPEITYEPCPGGSGGHGEKFVILTEGVTKIQYRSGTKKVFKPKTKRGESQILLKSTTPYDSSQLYHIETTDGNDYIGSFVRQNIESITIATDNLGEITILRKNLKRMEPIKKEQLRGGHYWFDNPHSTRYFFGPNGYGLRGGEGYYQNTWIFFNQVSYGFTNNFSVGVGTIPIFLFGADVFPFWLTPKFSFPIQKDKLNACAGVFYVNVFAGDSDAGGAGSGVGIAYGAMTFGSRDNNTTLGLGYGFADGDWARNPAIMLSGMYRGSKRHFLITENYLLPGENLTVILSIGGRWVAKRIAIDYGLFRPFNPGFGDGFIALPWLGITAPFGNKMLGY